MSKQDLEEFFEGKKDNESVINSWVEAGSPEEQAEIAREEGYDVEAEDIESYLEEAEGDPEGDGELSEEQLENVAGGVSDKLWDNIAAVACFDSPVYVRSLMTKLRNKKNSREFNLAIYEHREKYIDEHGEVPDLMETAKWIVHDYSDKWF